MVFLDCFMCLVNFRISGVATYEPSLGPFLGPKKKIFKPPYLRITFGTNMTFLQNTAEEVIDLPSRQINDYLQKGNRKKIELAARPPWSNPSNLKSVVGQKAVSGDQAGLVSHVSEIRCVPYGQVRSAQQELHSLLSQPILTRIMPEKGSYRRKKLQSLATTALRASAARSSSKG